MTSLADLPEIPILTTEVKVDGALLIGHTWDLTDDVERIWVDPSHNVTLEEGVAPVVFVGCSDCQSPVTHVPDERDPTVTWMVVLTHQRGCPWFTAALAAPNANGDLS